MVLRWRASRARAPLLAVQAINDSRTLSLPTFLSLFVMDNDDS